MTKSILVTGGAGFIGGNFVLHWLGEGLGPVVNVDALTYAGHRETLASLAGNAEHTFVHGDICDAGLMKALLEEHRPRAIVHFAAESHVDRSILGPEAFVRTNIEGTYTLLEVTRAYMETLAEDERRGFRFLHVSTDEVYGALGPGDAPFSEATPYAPSSPYAASKAAADMLARAWFQTYGVPVVVTHCSNNYGPYQLPEKLIPLVITHALAGKPLPIYGDGLQVRDWLYVADHCRAIAAVLERGAVGETYNVGGGNQWTNREVVERICSLLDELVPESPHRPHARLIVRVEDRPGHDRRYAIDAGKMERELGWRAQESLETGLRKTVAWYLEQSAWVEGVTSASHEQWLAANYNDRMAVSR